MKTLFNVACNCKHVIYILLILFINSSVFSQGAAINIDGTLAHPSSILDVSSQNKGILIPRMTEAQKLSIPSPANGLLIYQTDSIVGFWYFDSLQWNQLAGSSQNAPTNSIGQGTNFGNTPYWDGNQWVVSSSNIFNDGYSVGIGTNSPEPSAIIDINSVNKGALIPRMTTNQRNSITIPAEGLLIFNTTTKCFESFVLNNWNTVSCPASCFPPNTPDTIYGNVNTCENSSYVFSIDKVNSATHYEWAVPNGWTIVSGQGSESIIVNSGSAGQNGNITVKAANHCGKSAEKVLAVISNPYLLASVSILSYPVDTACVGENIIFTATPFNGGNSPTFQWKINNLNVGSNSNTFSSTTLTENDTVVCELTSNALCISGSPAISNQIQLQFVDVPDSPTASTHLATNSQIEWNWNSVANAIGYKFNTVNNFANATDCNSITSFIQTGLNGNTFYNLYVWAYNECGPSDVCILTETTLFLCGDNVNVQHTVGSISPVNKNVTYKTKYSNATGENKCWITQNLGASNEASSPTDATEEAAGWYWQFNHPQGFKHDGNSLTPSAYWLSSFSESSSWTQSNDPCYLLLGNGWRLPTYNEYNNFSVVTGWNDYWDAFNSLKFHSAGEVSYNNATLGSRGSYGRYWTNTQTSTTQANYLRVGDSYINMGDSFKYWGFTVRCLKD